ncbi:hypothetical protein B0T16DRAFT_488839 [Cercophora newfieldiana]|uniref:DUF7704 domain-containing protein n=1 Tax=Cercophora newfieldiana TaxID=92897 RepID=A0AA40D229_9PEZI|nr:hypothetical protein B0T16DRAFT_488839 [Cercophora newfieldiana]
MVEPLPSPEVNKMESIATFEEIISSKIYKFTSSAFDQFVNGAFKEAAAFHAELESVSEETFILFAQYAYDGTYELLNVEPKSPETTCTADQLASHNVEAEPEYCHSYIADLSPKTSTSIPISHFILTKFEPTATFYGVYLAFADPNDLIFNHFSRGTISYEPQTQVLYNQLAGMWSFLALIEVVVLGGFDDLRLWKRVCFCLLACDAFYYHYVAGPVGGWLMFWDLRGWTGWDCFINGALLMLTTVRLSVILARGVEEGKEE